MKIIDQVIDHFGNQTILAKKLDVDPMRVHQWTKRQRIPRDFILPICDISSGKFTAEEILRDD